MRAFLFLLLALSVDGALATDPPGTVVLSGGARNFTVGETVSLRQVVRLSEPLGPGASILVARHWLFPPSLKGVAVRASGITFRPYTAVRDGLHGGMYGQAALPAFEIVEGTLSPGDEIVVTYDRLTLPALAINRYYLPLYLKTSMQADWQLLDAPPFGVNAGGAEVLDIFGPGRVAQGSSFTLMLRMTDRHGNLALGRFPSLEVMIDGTFNRRVEAGEDPTPVLSLAFDRPGKHEVEIRSAGGGIRATKTIEVGSVGAYETRWVELHAHSNLSDGLLSATELKQRYLGVVDDLVIADHDTLLTADEWMNHEFSALDGLVWSRDVQSGGHHLVLSRDPMSINGVPAEVFANPLTLREEVRQLGGIVVALPEVPADVRLVDPATLRLVEIKSGEGTFEWFGNRFARLGYRVGFTGSSTSHIRQVGKPSSTGRTAVMIAPGESLLDALAAGRTWVTSGPRIEMSVNVNGSMPGERAPSNPLRQVSGRVTGTAPIQRVELVRNGEIVDSRDYARLDDSPTVKVTFESATEPLHGQLDVPRNGREWIGYLRATGTEILGVDAPGFEGSREAAVINPGDASRVDFITWTRGGPSGFFVDINPEAEDAVLELALKSGHEDTDQAGVGRKPADIPAATFIVSLAELIGGGVSRQYDVDGYQDKVTFELVDRSVASGVEFAFNDRREHAEGDYYYIRVTQLDDHRAWSSPVFVGGFDVAR